MQTRREFLKNVSFGIAVLGLTGCKAGSAQIDVNKAVKKPNIIFIMTDDQGYGDTTVYNPDSKIPTPRMEQLASEGITFTDAHSSAAWCIPSRYALLTGRYHWREKRQGELGYYGPPVIKSGRLTVGDLLQQQGYTTACIGKWHLGMEWHMKDGSVISNGRLNQQPMIDFTKPVTEGPLQRGFDYFFGTSSCTTDDPPLCFIENDRVIGGIPVKVPDHTDENRLMYGLPGWKHEDADIEFTKKSVAFIETHVKEKSNAPFFLYLALSVPHVPWFPPDMVKGKSEAGDRGDQVVLADWSLGQVLDTLDRLNLTDNTLIIFTSDNGPREGVNGHRSSGNWRGYKQDLWEGGHRMPFIARWPGKIKPGMRSDEMLCHTDIMTTIAAIVGVDLPEDAGEDSFNMLPALLDEPRDKPIREAIVHRAGTDALAIRQDDWKLILGRPSRRRQADKVEDMKTPADVPSLAGKTLRIGGEEGEEEKEWAGDANVKKELKLGGKTIEADIFTFSFKKDGVVDVVARPEDLEEGKEFEEFEGQYEQDGEKVTMWLGDAGRTAMYDGKDFELLEQGFEDSAPRVEEESNSMNSGQLYNLRADPGEKNNLWDKYPDVVERLTKLLEKYKKQGYSRPI